jgi:hypothetical protein
MSKDWRDRYQQHGYPADIQVEICPANRCSRFADIQQQSQKTNQLIPGSEGIGCARIAVTKRSDIQTEQDFSQPNGKRKRSAQKRKGY